MVGSAKTNSIGSRKSSPNWIATKTVSWTPPNCSAHRRRVRKVIADRATEIDARKGIALLRDEDNHLAMANDVQKGIVLRKDVANRLAMGIVGPREIVLATVSDVPKGIGLVMANVDRTRIARATANASPSHARKDARRDAKRRNLATRRSPRPIHRDGLDGTRLLKRPGVRQRTSGRLV